MNSVEVNPYQLPMLYDELPTSQGHIISSFIFRFKPFCFIRLTVVLQNFTVGSSRNTVDVWCDKTNVPA
jgi:hypothetical protein